MGLGVIMGSDSEIVTLLGLIRCVHAPPTLVTQRVLRLSRLPTEATHSLSRQSGWLVRLER